MMTQLAHKVLAWERTASGIFLDPEEHDGMSIIEAIAASDRVAAFHRARDRKRPAEHVRQEATQWENLSKILRWFQERGQVDTIGDMLDKVRGRSISFEVIALWADEMFAMELLPPCRLHAAIMKAYPEVRERMEFQQQRQIEESLRRSREIIENM